MVDSTPDGAEFRQLDDVTAPFGVVGSGAERPSKT